MKTFKFEVTITERDLEGDEFWEDAVAKDGTGIADVTDALARAIDDSNFIIGSGRSARDVVKLISFSDGQA